MKKLNRAQKIAEGETHRIAAISALTKVQSRLAEMDEDLTGAADDAELKRWNGEGEFHVNALRRLKETL